MKKLLIVILTFISWVSYGQISKIKFDKVELCDMNVLLGTSLDIMGDFKINKYGGIGFDVYNTHVIDNVEKNGYGIYYITPSIQKFDMIIGMGWVSDYLPQRQYQTVSGYTKTNGTYVNSYNRSTDTKLVATNTKTYSIVGVGKTFSTYGIGLTVRGVVRFLPTGNTPDLQVGLNLSL